MKKIFLIFRKKDCMGCHACEVACKQEHGLDVGPRLVRVLERGPDFVPIYCHHCANAPCIEACPEDAITRNEQGVVLITADLCIGCKACLDACPFGAIQYDDDQEKAVKCDLCIERLQRGESPACSNVCPTQCIFWGDTKQFFDRMDNSIT